MDQKRINIIIVHGELQEVLQFLMLVEWLEEPRIGGIMELNTKLHLMLSKVVPSDVVGVGLGSGSAFRVQVGFRDQHFGEVPLGFLGVFKVKIS